MYAQVLAHRGIKQVQKFSPAELEDIRAAAAAERQRRQELLQQVSTNSFLLEDMKLTDFSVNRGKPHLCLQSSITVEHEKYLKKPVVKLPSILL